MNIDLSGKRALVAGVADDGGFGFAIAKALAKAGATVCIGTWPPALGIFTTLLARGKFAASLDLGDGQTLSFERIYPLDADFDTDADMPQATRENKRYRELGDVSIEGLANRLRADFGEPCLDILVHSLANGPDVKKPLLQTSRRGYLAAVGTSAYSLTSLVARLAPIMCPNGSVLALSYLAGERVVPGYGGGMSSAKAALESDMRTLSFEAGRKWGFRVNAISAGPMRTLAGAGIGDARAMFNFQHAHAPLRRTITLEEVGGAGLYLLSPLSTGVTGEVHYVDSGYNIISMPRPEEL